MNLNVNSTFPKTQKNAIYVIVLMRQYLMINQ